MRLASRLLSSVKPARYLEPGTPTGLTGLVTHPAPRTTLIYLYCSTLEKLQQFPESSAYRQSTEPLTKHRLKIVNSIVPPGYTEWYQKANEIIEKHPEAFTAIDEGATRNNIRYAKDVRGGSAIGQSADDAIDEWDGEEVSAGELEGTRSTAERATQAGLLKEFYGKDFSAGWVEGTEEAADNIKEIRSRIKKLAEDKKPIDWPVEPQLTADQVAEVEKQIGAGLIEEVIQVAEGELELVDVMAKAKVWEDLEEKPVDGQWTYFKRETSTPVR